MGKEVKDAKKVQKAVRKGKHIQKKHKLWKTVSFRRPRTLKTRKSPKYLKKANEKYPSWDENAIIKNPLATESAMKTIEDHNTLVFIVNRLATKKHIKEACQKLYKIKVQKVNTLIRPDGEKKAYVLIPKEQEALDIANKIGIMQQR